MANQHNCSHVILWGKRIDDWRKWLTLYVVKISWKETSFFNQISLILTRILTDNKPALVIAWYQNKPLSGWVKNNRHYKPLSDSHFITIARPCELSIALYYMIISSSLRIYFRTIEPWAIRNFAGPKNLRTVNLTPNHNVASLSVMIWGSASNAFGIM